MGATGVGHFEYRAADSMICNNLECDGVLALGLGYSTCQVAGAWVANFAFG